MITIEEFRTLALSFPGTLEAPHFERCAFKVEGRRIFATLHEASATANLKLSEADQPEYCNFDKQSVYPVPNKWGLKGWTTFDLKGVTRELMLDALETAYHEVFKSKGKK